MTTPSDLAFVDTNVLVYAADSSAVFHEASKNLIERAADGRLELAVSPQILAEFIVVVTNPNVLAMPMPKEEAYAHVDELRLACRVVSGTPDVIDRLMQLLLATGISGKRVHDVLHAATMLENGITQIYTYDTGFSAIPGITMLDPKDAAQ